MDKLLLSPIALSILAALFYGVGGPFMKSAVTNGATTCGVSLMYGVFAVIFSLNFSGPAVFFSSWKGFGYALITGICFGVALVCVGRAMSLKEGYASVVTVIVAFYPLVTVLIGLCTGEAANTNVLRLVLGSILVVGGICLVATSSSAPAH